MTTATRPAPNHDKLTCYTEYRCRLPECVDRYNTRLREVRRARKAGTYNDLIDAAPVRRHITRLLMAGMTAEAIATAAGVSAPCVRSYIKPTHSKHRGRTHRATRDTAAKILAVTPQARISGRIESVGTRRRVQALIARGWPANHIARRAGLSPRNANDLLRRELFYLSTIRAIDAVYEQLRGKRPEQYGVDKGHAKASRSRAQAHRWPPPRYWDAFPDAIDDPHFEPMWGLTAGDRLAEDALWLEDTQGYSRADAAARLGVKKDALQQAISRWQHKQGLAA